MKVGDKLPTGAKVVTAETTEHDDGSVTHTWEDDHGNRTVEWTPSEDSLDHVRAQIDQKLRDALIANASWLKDNKHPADDHLAALTRQVNALIARLNL